MKNILFISGSPKSDGNTAVLAEWFAEGAYSKGAQIRFVSAAKLNAKSSGCTSCRACQKRAEYGCVIDDDISGVLENMAESDAIVFATPLYFFSASAQLKMIVDRMFSLYKWDNDKGTMETVLAGKDMVLIASAYEGVGLDALEKPFALTAEYTSMNFSSLLVPYAGVSGEIASIDSVRERAIALGEQTGEG